MGSLFSVVGLSVMGAFLSIASHGISDRTPLIHFSSKPAILAVKKSKDSNETEQVSLQALVETRCQSLFTEFHPIWWLFNGHLQTIYCVLGNFSKNDEMWYNRGLDFAPIDDSNLKDNTPVVVVQHGLTGGSYEPYPWDLKQNSLGYEPMPSLSPPPANSPLNTRLLRTFVGKHVYSKGMGGNLQNLLKRHEKSLRSELGHRVAKAMPLALALRNPTLEQFDDTFTRIAGGSAPTFPFATADDYYRWGSSHHVVKDIRVPYLAINAADDPVVRHVPMDGGGNGLVVMELTPAGGHLGWFQAGNGFVDRWTTRPVLEWLKLTAEDIAHIEGQAGRLSIDEDGWLREDSSPELGCKEIEGGGLFDGNGGEEGMLQGL
ncbi:hypothetical protein H0H87_000041 [Tephrocybe sp. NHM501043]|nr:hypothetical protein H0H87_000041 [Tephrocybe sp. NHM501043]